MDPIVVVGAGISGVTCAQTLRGAGLPVRVLERSRTPGGRMASRRIEGRRVDLGASYFTVSDPRFEEQVAAWREAGLARPWTDTFDVRTPDAPPEQKAGPLRWGAGHGLRSLVEHAARELDVSHHEVGSVDLTSDGRLLVDGHPSSAVVLAMPDPQAARLLAPGLGSVAETLDDPFEPILALSARWDERRWEPDGAFVNGDDELAWIADDGRRRGDGAAVLVAHSTPDLARRHLEEPTAALPHMVAAVMRVLEIDTEPRHAAVHRWTYAKPTRPREQPYLLDDSGVACCGDAWSSSAKVEGAFLSGRELGLALASRWG